MIVMHSDDTVAHKIRKQLS